MRCRRYNNRIVTSRGGRPARCHAMSDASYAFAQERDGGIIVVRRFQETFPNLSDLPRNRKIVDYSVVVHIVVTHTLLDVIQLNGTAAASTECCPMLHSENIGVCNLSIKNDEGLASGNFVAKFRSRDYGFGDLRSVSGNGNRCMNWIVRENRTGMKSFVRMRYAIIEKWLLPFFQHRRDNVPFDILCGSPPGIGQLNWRWYGCTLQLKLGRNNNAYPGTLVNKQRPVHRMPLPIGEDCIKSTRDHSNDFEDLFPTRSTVIPRGCGGCFSCHGSIITIFCWS